MVLMTSLQARFSVAFIAALSLAPASASAALAQGPVVPARWVIAKAAIAPWADPQQLGGPEEEKRLVGRTVTFGTHSVTGPAPLGCAHATYSFHDDTPDLLFEGGLAEPDRRGKPRDAAALARGLGMTTKTVRTVETGCSEVAFHRIAQGVLVFGLNNRIYTLRPDPTAGR
jgi:hypothetical protein